MAACCKDKKTDSFFCCYDSFCTSDGCTSKAVTEVIIIVYLILFSGFLISLPLLVKPFVQKKIP